MVSASVMTRSTAVTLVVIGAPSSTASNARGAGAAISVTPEAPVDCTRPSSRNCTDVGRVPRWYRVRPAS